MKRLFGILLIVFMMAQFVSLAEEIGFDNSETVIIEQLEEEVQETTADLATEEMPSENSSAVQEVISGEAVGEGKALEQETVEYQAFSDDPAISGEVFSEEQMSSSEEMTPDVFVPEMAATEVQEVTSVASEEAVEEEIKSESTEVAEPQTIVIEEGAQIDAPKALAESSGFIADEIDLLYKKADATLDKGMVKQIDLGGEYGSNWKSSNKKVATVNRDGVVTCKARGTTKITVKAKQKHGKTQYRTLVLRVVDPADPDEVYVHDGMQSEVSKGIQYSHEYSWHVVPGFSHQMDADVYPVGSNKNITWKSSNKKVISITKAGYMTCLKPGTARITVKTDNGLSAWLDIIVEKNDCEGVYNIDKGLAYSIEDGSVRIYLKSLNVVNNKRVDAVFYLCNGTNKKIKKLRNVRLAVNCGYLEYNNGATYPFLSKRISRINVNCKGQRWTTFKVRFTGKEIVDPEWFLNNPDIIMDEDYSCSY